MSFADEICNALYFYFKAEYQWQGRSYSIKYGAYVRYFLYFVKQNWLYRKMWCNWALIVKFFYHLPGFKFGVAFLWQHFLKAKYFLTKTYYLKEISIVYICIVSETKLRSFCTINMSSMKQILFVSIDIEGGFFCRGLWL